MTRNAYDYASPLGTLRLTAQNGRLCVAAFVDGPCAENMTSDPVLRAAAAWLDRLFSGEDPGPLPPYTLRGTPFQTAVWQALLTVPYGETVSYGALAARCGRDRRYARAIGAAVGKNPLAIFVPCHRVLGADGALTGYAYGTARKRALLELEQG